ncbi:MAG: M24 family metallopeptidase [Atopobiaceae bacterium]
MKTQRTDAVLMNMQKLGVKQAIFTDPLSIWYLTGYYTEPYERFFALLVSGETGTVKTTLFVNKLFPDATGAADTLVTFDDTDDPLPLVLSHLTPGAPLGVDKSLEARWLLPLVTNAQVGSVLVASNAVDQARSIKDAAEQELMREASRINDKAMDWLVDQLHVGVTEQTIAEGLLKAYRALGAEGFSFTPIVSFGAHAADPHHEPDETPLAAGDMVLFDVGCTYQRYCSDMTRTFFTQKPTARQLEVYDTVRRANEAAEALIAPGVEFAELDLCARKVIEDAGYGMYFTHRLGHQIGLVDHEPGDVSSTHHEPVRPGQCFSIEPGIYIPGEIGVRIEDLAIVQEGGHEILNAYSHEPRVIPLS